MKIKNYGINYESILFIKKTIKTIKWKLDIILFIWLAICIQMYNINDHKEIEYDIRNFVGQVVNELPNERGILFYNSGNRYEGDF